MPGEGAEAVLWPILTPLGFLLLAALIIVLGASSTAKYEFERNQARTQRQPQPAATAAVAASGTAAVAASGAPEPAAARTAPGGAGTAATGTLREHAPVVGTTGHPAGRRRVDPATPSAWWLVDEAADPAGEHVVAGPFEDRLDADWAALSSGLSGSVRAVHAVQRADGGLARRQSAHEMAWLRELGDQLDRLPEDWDELLSDDDALTTLVVEVAAALVEAGLPLHDCAGSAPAGGVCLTPGPDYCGVVVSWHQHERLALEGSRAPAARAVQATMNGALVEVLEAAGFVVEPFGSDGCLLVTDVVGMG